VSAAVVLQLGRARARSITRQLAGSVDVALDLMVEAYEGRVWAVLGHDTWAAYVAAEVPALKVIGKGLPADERRDVCTDLRRRGLSLRGIGEVLGLAPNTVRAALAGGVELPAEVVSLDGSRRSSTSTGERRRRRGPAKTDRTVTLLAGAGPDGLTVRDVARALKCPQHMAAATLTRLEDAGRILYRRPERRGMFGRYVVEGDHS
jgi:hypothetical protein